MSRKLQDLERDFNWSLLDEKSYLLCTQLRRTHPHPPQFAREYTQLSIRCTTSPQDEFAQFNGHVLDPKDFFGHFLTARLLEPNLLIVHFTSQAILFEIKRDFLIRIGEPYRYSTDNLHPSIFTKMGTHDGSFCNIM